MLSVENPESDAQTYSIAPAEGQKPISIMTDSSFEEMSNPDKFCFGTGGFHTERPRKITYRKYFNQRLLDVDGRFARDMDYSQPHLIGTWLIGSSGSDQDFSPDKPLL